MPAQLAMPAKFVAPAVAVGSRSGGEPSRRLIALIVKNNQRKIGRPGVSESRQISQIHERASVRFQTNHTPVRKSESQTQAQWRAYTHVDLIKVGLRRSYGMPFSRNPAQSGYNEISFV